MNLTKHRTAFTLIAAVLILSLAVATAFWARGFKPNFKKARIDRTGLIVATSIPTGAQVYLDDRLMSATDTNIAFLEPKTYKVRIEKEGFARWEKDIEIKADLATEIKALLFPNAPEIKPLTTTGAANPTISPDGSKIAYGVTGVNGGLYSLSMSDRPFPFRQGVKILAKNQLGFDFSQGQYLWNPDSKQVIARFNNTEGIPTANLLIDTEKSEQELRDITASLTPTLNSWQEEINTRAQTLAIIVPENIKAATGEAKLVNSSKSVVNSSESNPQLPTTNFAQQNTSYPLPTTLLNYYPTGLIFSPDEEKVLYLNTESKYKVYDLKNKKEYAIPDLPDFIGISWFPDSNHLTIAQKGLISVIEADGANKTTIYSGKFENGFVFTHPSGTRIITLTALTQPEGSLPNLYSINLR